MSNVPHALEFDQSSEQKKAREVNIELGRICCCISIIGIHAFPLSSYDFSVMPIANVIFGTGFRMFATPFFFLTMGAFMSSRTPYVKQWSRFITKIVIPYIFTLFLMVQLLPLAKGELGIWGVLTKMHVDVSDFFWTLVTLNASRHFEGFGHLWFIECLFLCYILLPAFRIFLHDSPLENRHKRNMLLVGFVALIIPHTLKSFAGNSYLQDMRIINGYPFIWVLFLLLGNYIHAWMTKNSIHIGLYVYWITPFVFLLFCMLNFYLTWEYDLDDNLSIKQWAFTSTRSNIAVVFPNILPFIWFHCVAVKNPMKQKIILWASDKCFYIYLVHMLVLMFLKNFSGVTNNRFLGNLAQWISCCIFSFFIACILKIIERRVYAITAIAIARIRREIVRLRARLKEISTP